MENGERQCIIKCGNSNMSAALNEKIKELGFPLEYSYTSCGCHAMDDCSCRSSVDGYILNW